MTDLSDNVAEARRLINMMTIDELLNFHEKLFKSESDPEFNTVPGAKVWATCVELVEEAMLAKALEDDIG